MKKNRKPSAVRAFSAQGKNGMDSYAYYKFRKYYKDNAYPEVLPDYGVHAAGFELEPKSLDLWYDKPYFGKYDMEGNPIYIGEANLKQITAPNSNETFFIIDFAADAFYDLQKHFAKAIAQKKLDPEFKLARLAPKQAWISATSLHHDFLKNVYEVFIGTYVEKENLHCRIESFEDFMKYFMLFMRDFGMEIPLTRTGFVGSKRCPLNTSGLIIDLENTNLGDDSKKVDQLLSQTSFSFYISAAKNFGFTVDKNIPSRLIVDLSSPVMQKYMKDYNVNSPKEVIDRYYRKTYKSDIQVMFSYLVRFYNAYAKTRPNVSKPIRKFSPGGVGSTKESAKTLTFNKRRKALSKTDIYQSLYTEQEMLKMYFDFRCYEVGATFSDLLKRDIMADATKRLNVFGNQEAMTYINDKIVEESKINLTIGTEYVRGNNINARVTIKARTGEVRRDEPRIKDVLSSNYS